MAITSENTIGIKLQTTGASTQAAEHAKAAAGLKLIKENADRTNAALRRMSGAFGSGLATVARRSFQALTVATAAATAAMLKSVHAAVQMGDALADLSQQTSVPIKSLALLQQAFTLANVGADRVGDSISKMLRTLSNAPDSKALSARFEMLGLSLEKIRKLAPEDQFAEIGAAIAALRDPAEQTAAAMEIFGRGGAELLAVFKDGGALTTAKRQLGDLPALLERNAAGLSALADAGDGVKLKWAQLGAGFLNVVLPQFDKLADRINSVDLSGFGRQVGVWTNLLIKAVKDDRIGEFLALNLDAGFEIFKGFVKTSFLTTNFWTGLGNVLVTTANKFLEVLVEGIYLVSHVWVATVHYVGSLLKSAFLSAANALGSDLADAINLYIDSVNTLFGTSISNVVYTAKDTGAASFAESWTWAGTQVEKQLVKVRASLQSITEGYRRDVGGAPGGKTDIDTRRAKLALEEDEVRQQEALTDAYAANVKGYRDAVVALEDQRTAAQAVDDELNQIIEDSDYWLAQLDREKAISDAMARDKAIGSTFAGKTAQDFTQFQGVQGAEAQTGFGGVNAGAIAGLQQAMMDFGTTAQQVGTAISSSIGGAIDSISSSLTDVVLRVKTLGEAFYEIGRAILGTVVKAIIKMAVTWIAQRVIMATAGKAIAAASVAANIPIALAQSLIWIEPAILSTIASFGGAAEAAPAFIELAQMEGLLSVLGGFRSGGYTGGMSADDFAGLVHGREFVFSAPVTARLGREDLDSLHRGEASITRGSAGAPNFNVAVFNDQSEAVRFLRSNEGRGIVLDHVRQSRHEFMR